MESRHAPELRLREKADSEGGAVDICDAAPGILGKTAGACEIKTLLGRGMLGADRSALGAEDKDCPVSRIGDIHGSIACGKNIRRRGERAVRELIIEFVFHALDEHEAGFLYSVQDVEISIRGKRNRDGIVDHHLSEPAEILSLGIENLDAPVALIRNCHFLFLIKTRVQGIEEFTGKIAAFAQGSQEFPAQGIELHAIVFRVADRQLIEGGPGDACHIDVLLRRVEIKGNITSALLHTQDAFGSFVIDIIGDFRGKGKGFQAGKEGQIKPLGEGAVAVCGIHSSDGKPGVIHRNRDIVHSCGREGYFANGSEKAARRADAILHGMKAIFFNALVHGREPFESQHIRIEAM